MSDVAERLKKLRNEMSKISADCFFVPAADPHNNEYVPDHWQRRRFISNFSGSAGDAMITLDSAYLWTDPRYYLQAEIELDPQHFQLIKATQHNSPLYDWLQKQPKGFRLAIDPKVITINQARKLQEIVATKQASLELLGKNPIDTIWKDQPPLPNSEIRLLDIQFSGVSSKDKLAQLREKLREHNANAMVINNLAEIAWLLNIRGCDIDYNPLAIASLIVTENSSLLFVENAQISKKVAAYFIELGVKTLPPAQFSKQLNQLNGTVWLDADNCNYWIETQLVNAIVIYAVSPIALWKALKNPVEIRGMQEAHVHDAVAVIQFLHWLENHWRDGVTELSAANKLEALRRENPLCVDLSFNTISGFGPNSAIIHYAVNENSSLTINDSSIYLVDSGGQYQSGTTDITRTIHLGNPTAQQKKHYTLVLKGHLMLGNATFPTGTLGEHLNALARFALWQQGLDYGHGTSHGVGCYSCVHESPPRISAGRTTVPLQPNMVLSNEPGVYFANEYGIRIENLCRIIEVFSADKCKTGHGPFYGFEDLTLVPYCRKLIDVSLLTATEIKAINSYHQRVLKELLPHLIDKNTIKWLQQEAADLL